jgi:chromosome segregation ATPase
MPATFPPEARNDWSEGVADEVAHWIEELVREQAVPRDEYREVLSRLDVVETRLNGLDTRLDETNARLDRVEERLEKRFDKIDQRFERMETRFEEMQRNNNARFDAINERFDEMNKQTNARFDALHERFDTLNEAMRTQTRWAIGVLALFGTMTTVLMAIAVFSP